MKDLGLVSPLSFPCQKSITLYLQHRLNTSWINPFLVERSCFLLCLKIMEVMLRSFKWVSFQKYLNFRISNLHIKGSGTMVGEVDLGHPMSVFNAFVCSFSSFSSKMVCLCKCFDRSIDGLKKYL